MHANDEDDVAVQQTRSGRTSALPAEAAASQQSLHGVDCVSSAARETRTAAYQVIMPSPVATRPCHQRHVLGCPNVLFVGTLARYCYHQRLEQF